MVDPNSKIRELENKADESDLIARQSDNRDVKAYSPGQSKNYRDEAARLREDKGSCSPTEGQRTRAAVLADEQIDRMADSDATAEDQEERKERLIAGPSVFRDIRKDR